MKNRSIIALSTSMALIGTTLCSALANPDSPRALMFSDGTMTGWQADTENVWTVEPHGESGYKVSSGESATGILKSEPFTIKKEIQSFLIAGADGTANSTNDGDLNYVRLRAWPNGKILRQERPPGTHIFTRTVWHTADLIGRKVYLELVDMNPKLNPTGYAWIGLTDYQAKRMGTSKNTGSGRQSARRENR